MSLDIQCSSNRMYSQRPSHHARGWASFVLGHGLSRAPLEGGVIRIQLIIIE
jgi:hypothetical protein